MTRDPLESLLRLRRLAVDQARRGLADCLRIESEAAQSVAAIEAAIGHETEVAADLASGDAEVEAFAAWLRRIRPKQHAAHAAEAQAEAATVQGRAILAAARAAVQAAEEMLEQRAAARQEQAEHRAQRDIDAKQRSGAANPEASLRGPGKARLPVVVGNNRSEETGEITARPGQRRTAFGRCMTGGRGRARSRHRHRVEDPAGEIRPAKSARRNSVDTHGPIAKLVTVASRRRP